MKKVLVTLLLVVFSSTLFVSATESGKLSSLCDEWHMIVYPFMDVHESSSTYTQRLTSDTIINSVRYIKLQEDVNDFHRYEDGHYVGALREGNNRDIYYIPTDTTHEYLLYAFNAQVGDTLTNLWIGRDARYYQEYFQDGNCTAVVEAISDEQTRVFELQTIEESISSHGHPQRWTWVEGVGLGQGPVNEWFPIDVADPEPELLCAYKGGKRVYAKDHAKYYDCCHESSDVIQATKWYGVRKYTPPSNISSLSVRYSSIAYYLQGDTIINDTMYQACWKNNGEYFGGIRKSADGQQVYYRPKEPLVITEPAEPSEYLLYDFDVQVGDSLRAFDCSCPLCCDYEGCDPTLNTKWEVLETSIIDGRKHVRVRGGQSGHTIEWIEGIGTRNIFFEDPEYDVVYGEEVTYALCATDDEGNTLYSFDTDDLGIHNDCPNWEVLAVENVQSNKVQSTKFFRDGQLLIECNGKTYNAQGAEVR